MKRFILDFPLTCLCIAGIWVLCLIPIPETPLSDVPLIDKWTHFVMYGALVLLSMIEYLRHRRASRPFTMFAFVMFFWIAPILMGGLIELAQAYLTGGNRSGDPMDFVADSVGVVLGNAIGWPISVLHKRYQKKRAKKNSEPVPQNTVS